MLSATLREKQELLFCLSMVYFVCLFVLHNRGLRRREREVEKKEERKIEKEESKEKKKKESRSSRYCNCSK